MNWKIRIKNPVFWVQVLTGALATVLAYSGLTAADMRPRGQGCGALLPARSAIRTACFSWRRTCGMR